MKDFVKSYWKWLLIGLLALGLFLQFGGMTVVVVNRALEPICEVHVATKPEPAEWGPNRLRNPVPPPQSRDIHLPVYMNFLKTGDNRVFYTWALDCKGNLINQSSHTGRGSLFLWEVTR